MAGDPRVLLQQAERALKGASGGWSFFSDRSEKYENAANLFKQAANVFQMQEQYMEAGRTFERLAQIHSTNLNEPNDATNALYDAFKVYRMCNPEDAVRVLSSVVQHYVVTGNRRRAATEKHNLGEVYELELRDIHKALEAYEQAGKWYKLDNAPALANKSLLKAADLAVLEKDYYKAADYYDSQADWAAGNGPMKHSVKPYLFKASLCYLAVDLVKAVDVIEKYLQSEKPGDQAEFNFLEDLRASINEKRPDDFAAQVAMYSQKRTLEPWQHEVLKIASNALEGPVDDFA